MRTLFAIIGFVVVALVLGTCVAVCTDDDDERGLPSPACLVAAPWHCDKAPKS